MIRATLRSSDVAARLADGTYGLMLEDTPGGRRGVGGRAAAASAGHPAGRPGAARRRGLLPGPGAHADRHRARRPGRLRHRPRVAAGPHRGRATGPRARRLGASHSGSSAPRARPGQRIVAGCLAQPGDEALHRHAVDLDDRRRARRSAGRWRCRPCRRSARRRPGPPRTRASTSPSVRAAQNSAMRASISSRAAMRPLKVCRSARSPKPMRSITRAATDSAEVDTATQCPSAHCHVPRGTEYGMPGAEPRLQVAGGGEGRRAAGPCTGTATRAGSRRPPGPTPTRAPPSWRRRRPAR